MTTMRWLILIVIAVLLAQAWNTPAARTAERGIRVAVASNFIAAARSLVRTFRAETGQEVTLITGSTGRLYAQIRHGAPFDAFLAADTARPERLEREGQAISGSRFTYATGRLVLWSPAPGRIDRNGAVLKNTSLRRLAMANPKLAPYGRAARQVLRKLGLWTRLQKRIVRGENVGQTYQLIRSGNAEMGFIALSQLRGEGAAAGGSAWMVPPALYDPIAQQAVLLDGGAGGFLAFLRTERARQIIRSFGYGTP